MLVHFPIVFFLTLAAFDIVASLRGSNVTSRGWAGSISFGLAALSGIFALATYYFGGVALDVAEAGGFHSDVAETHEHLGLLVAMAFALWAVIRGIIWWRNLPLAGPMRLAVPVIEIAGVVLVLATAYYGGQLVYDLGVNVARAAGA